MSVSLKNREILVGVSGGIAAYKTAYLVSRLKQAGAGVTVIMTSHAVELVSPRTFQALSGRPVQVEMFGVPTSAHVHIDTARQCDLLCVAPATANILAKAASGIADDLLSTTILAFQGPILFAPAMNATMWKKQASQRNVRTLQDDGYFIIGPENGYLSCGEIGIGRMAEPETIFTRIAQMLQNESLF